MTGRMNAAAWNLILQRISGIRDDHRSGATALTRDAAGVVAQMAELELDRDESLLEALVTAGRLLVKAQPFMASLVNLAGAALEACETAGPEDPRILIKASVSRFLSQMDESTEAIAAAAANLLAAGKTVLTHSSSEGVRRALAEAHRSGHRLRVICTESRPLCEGTALAKSLGNMGIPVTLIVDAAMAAALAEVDLVLVGADAVTPEFVVNKAGTSMLALAARELGRKMYALAGPEKFLPSGYRLPSEVPKDPAEVLGESPAGVQARNLYFDRTPVDWLAGIISRDGVLDARDLRKRLGNLSLHRALR
jgi:translation initiation factor 2B subunit (eIF-2B alpha/beta/delta family)